MAPTIGASRTARLLRPTDSLHQSRNGQSRSAEFLAPSLRGLWVAVAAEAHTHNLKIVFVGTVGQALRNALRLPPPPPPRPADRAAAVQLRDSRCNLGRCNGDAVVEGGRGASIWLATPQSYTPRSKLRTTRRPRRPLILGTTALALSQYV